MGSSKVFLSCKHFEAELVDILVCARPFGSRSAAGKGSVVCALLLQAGAFPGSQQCSAAVLPSACRPGMPAEVHFAKHTTTDFSHTEKVDMQGPTHLLSLGTGMAVTF